MVIVKKKKWVRGGPTQSNFLQLMLDVLEALDKAGTSPGLVHAGREAIKSRREKHSAAGQKAKGKHRPTHNPLPWDKIMEWRRRGKTWDWIADRLQTQGIKTSRHGLDNRVRAWLETQKKVTVSRG